MSDLLFAKAALHPNSVDVVFVPLRPTQEQAEAITAWDKNFIFAVEEGGFCRVSYAQFQLGSVNGLVATRRKDGTYDFYRHFDFHSKYALIG